MRPDCPCRRRPVVIGGTGRAAPAWWAARGAQVGRGGADPSAVVGLFAGPDDFLSEVASLDNRWNAIASELCGHPNALRCETPAALQLGPQWIASFRSTLESWRSARDGWRESMLPGFFASVGSDAAELARFRRELEAFQQDAARVTGTTPAPPPDQQPGILENAAGALGDAVRDAALPAALVLGAVVVVAVSRR